MAAASISSLQAFEAQPAWQAEWERTLQALALTTSKSSCARRIDPEQDSLRIDIPKDDVPEHSRRVEGANYVVTERPEWMDMKPILKLVNEAWKKGN